MWASRPRPVGRTVPTRIGASRRRDRALIWAPARRSSSGEMSEAFSGHSTRSGRAWVPDSTSSAYAAVTSRWFSRTARRWALKSRPRRGTLPWITATSTVSVASRVGVRAAPATRPSATSGTARSATAARTGRRPVAASRRERSISATPRAAPSAERTNPISGVPPREANGSRGPSAWPNASRPQGKPPQGQDERIHSHSDHQPATPSTAPTARGLGRGPGASPARRMTTAPAPNAARYRASTSDRPQEAYAPTYMPTHGTSSRKKPRPETRPRRAPVRARGGWSPEGARTTTRRAIASSAVHHRPYGGNEAARSAPEAAAKASLVMRGIRPRGRRADRPPPGPGGRGPGR